MQLAITYILIIIFFLFMYIYIYIYIHTYICIYIIHKAITKCIRKVNKSYGIYTKNSMFYDARQHGLKLFGFILSEL